MKINKLYKIHFNNFGVFWTNQEIEILKNEYPLIGLRGTMQKLPHRSREAIRTMACHLHIKRPPEERGDGFNPKIIKNLSDCDKAYLAGFFDGEGTIHIREKYPRPGNGMINPSHQLHIAISNTNKFVIEKFYNLLGGAFITINPPKNRIKSKICYRWSIDSRKAKQILEIMYPYLIVKKEEAEIAITFQNNIKYSSKKLTIEEINTRRQLALKLSELKGRIK